MNDVPDNTNDELNNPEEPQELILDGEENGLAEEELVEETVDLSKKGKIILGVLLSLILLLAISLVVVGSRKSDLQDENKELKAQVSSLEADLSTTTEAKDELAEENELDNATVEEQEAQIAAKQKELEKLSAELEKQTAAMEAQTEELATVEELRALNKEAGLTVVSILNQVVRLQGVDSSQTADALDLLNDAISDVNNILNKAVTEANACSDNACRVEVANKYTPQMVAVRDQLESDVTALLNTPVAAAPEKSAPPKDAKPTETAPAPEKEKTAPDKENTDKKSDDTSSNTDKEAAADK